MGVLKIIGLGFLVLFVLGAVGIMLMPVNYETNGEKKITGKVTETRPSPEESSSEPKIQLIDKSAEEMLPDPSQFPTKYKIGEVKTIKENVSGFVEGKSLFVHKYEVSVGYPYDVVGITFKVYKFSDINSAKEFYNNKVEKVKKRRGYTKVNIRGLNGKCFSWKESQYSTDDLGVSNCYNKNVYYEVQVSIGNGMLETAGNYLGDATRLLDRKVK